MQIHQGILSDLLPQVQIVVMIGSRASDQSPRIGADCRVQGRAADRIEAASELSRAGFPAWTRLA